MEAKFFSEIEKNMDVKTLKDFEKEVRGKIIDEFETLRNKNDDLSRVLMAGECEMWEKIRRGDYSWLKIVIKRRNFLDLLIDIISINIIILIFLDLFIEKVKKLKDTPLDSE